MFLKAGKQDTICHFCWIRFLEFHNLHSSTCVCRRWNRDKTADKQNLWRIFI